MPAAIGMRLKIVDYAIFGLAEHAPDIVYIGMWAIWVGRTKWVLIPEIGTRVEGRQNWQRIDLGRYGLEISDRRSPG